MNLYETQELIETIYNKNQQGKLIDKFINNMEDIEDYLEGDEVKHRIYRNILMLEDCRIETLIGMTTGDVTQHEDVFNKIVELATSGLINIQAYPDKLTVQSPIRLPADIKATIKQYMFLPPMLVQPKTLVTNRDSAYLTVAKDDVLLNGRNHNYEINLGHINRCNRVAYSINERVVRSIADKASHLDAPKPNESKEDFEKRIKAFVKFTKDSMKVFATMVNAGNRFYFSHNYDHRGRTYSRGYHINYQGNCYRKAIIELADKERLVDSTGTEFTPAEYLMIDIANNFGLDKKDYDERIQWFKENEHQLEDLVSQADEDALYMAGVIAWRDYQEGNQTGYMVSMDATSSGIQLLSLMTRCIRTASICNVIDVGSRQDAYKLLFNKLKEACERNNIPLGDIDHPKVKKAIMTFFYGSKRKPKELLGDDSPQLAQFYAVMAEHCSGAYEAGEYLLKLWNDKATEYSWVMPDLFTVYTKIMVKKEHKIVAGNIEIVVPYEVNEPVKDGREYPANVTHSVDAFVLRELVARTNYDPAQIKRALYWLEKTDYNPSIKATGMIKQFISIFHKTNMPSVAIVPFINDETACMLPSVLRKVLIGIMQEMLQHVPFESATTHDCFRCHPNHMHIVRRAYNALLGEILTGNILRSIVSDITGRNTPVPVKSLSTNLLSDFLTAVLNNRYSLT